jgi:CRP/FNR family cyclic AMP-dependent transcriptional regulator
LSAGEIAGYVASALVFATFYMKTMMRLRVIAIISNVAFITYALLDGLLPILILHAALLPLNILRLREFTRLMERTGAPRAAKSRWSRSCPS